MDTWELQFFEWYAAYEKRLPSGLAPEVSALARAAAWAAWIASRTKKVVTVPGESHDQ